MVPRSEGGEDTAENAIALCFDCHADVGSYNVNHPKGRKLSPSELRMHKEQWLKKCSNGMAIRDLIVAKVIAPKVFKVFEEEVIPKGSEYKWVDRKIREPKPSWRDLTDNRIAVHHYFFDQVLEYLEQKQFCIVVGDKDTGKTWLSYVSSHNFVKQGKEVRFTTVDEDFDAEDAWNEIETQKLRGNGKPEKYFVVEDCHKNPTESEEFFQKVLDEGEENLRFLFTMRKTGKVLLEDAEPDIFYDEGTERKYIVPLLPDKKITEHVQNIIKRFIEIKEIEYEVLEKELEDVAQKWGNDLYWVWLRLNSWRYDEGQNLSDITDDQLYDSVWSDRYEIKLSLMKRRNILLPIAAVCRFEPLKVAESFLRLQDIDEGVLKELKEEGIIQISGKRYDFLSIKESFADIILSCVLRKDPFFKENYRTKENYTIQIIKNYLMQKSSNPGNVFSVLYSARETEKAISAKKILGSLLDDANVWAVVKENVKDISLGQMISLLDSLLWVEGKKLWMKCEKVPEIRLCYLRQNYKNIQDKLRSSSARTIMSYLPLLARIVTLERFFRVFSISDYKHIINSSTINAIRLLFIHFQKWELYSAAKKMIEALLDADLARLVEKSASLYRLGGLIKEVKEADSSAATRFVENLSEMDLNGLFSRNDPDAERERLTKEQVVNYFLANRISFAPPHGGRIVNKIKDEVWNFLIYSASQKERFWLLWNVYRNSKDKANHLVKNNIGQFLLKTCDDEFYRMALMGLLHLCDFEIKNVYLPINTRGLLENELDKNTHIVLSLIALRVKLPPTSFQFFDIIKYTKERVNSIPDDPQLKELLQKLIEIYL